MIGYGGLIIVVVVGTTNQVVDLNTAHVSFWQNFVLWRRNADFLRSHMGFVGVLGNNNKGNT